MVTIFYNKEKTSFQIIKPSNQFNGDYKALVQAVSNGSYVSFDVN